jgi:hypothetical protein
MLHAMSLGFLATQRVGSNDEHLLGAQINMAQLEWQIPLTNGTKPKLVQATFER